MQTFDHHRGSTFECDGAELYFETSGRPDGAPVVLAHGGIGTLEDFNALLPALAGFRLIAMDSRGHGRSTRGAAPLNYERLAQDLAALSGHLGLHEPSLVGFSDGGIAALRLAARAQAGWRRVAVLGSRWELPAQAPVRALLGKVTPQSWRQKFPDTLARYQALNPQPDFERLVNDVVALWLDGSAQGHPGDSIERIAAPLLVVRGDDDHLSTRADAFTLAERVPGATLLSLPFAGHEVHKDQSDIVGRVLRSFLEK